MVVRDGVCVLEVPNVVRTLIGELGAVSIERTYSHCGIEQTCEDSKFEHLSKRHARCLRLGGASPGVAGLLGVVR